MVTRGWYPERGDLIWLTMTPQAGHEQSGRRPSLVLSPGEYNRRVGLALVCPVTSQVKGYPFEVAIPPGVSLTGVVLADQVRSFDWRARGAERIDRLPSDVTTSVLQKAARLLEV